MPTRHTTSQNNSKEVSKLHTADQISRSFPLFFNYFILDKETSYLKRRRAGPNTKPFLARPVTLLKTSHSVHAGSPCSMFNTNYKDTYEDTRQFAYKHIYIIFLFSFYFFTSFSSGWARVQTSSPKHPALQKKFKITRD